MRCNKFVLMVRLSTVFVIVSVLTLSFVFAEHHTAALQFGSKCTTPSGESAVCTHLYTCRSIINDIWRKTTAALKYSLNSHCGCDDNGPLVCCGLESSSTKHDRKPISRPIKPLPTSKPLMTTTPLDKQSLLPSLVICGRQQSDDRLESRNNTQVDDFPWVVILHNNGTNFTNAGTLINRRYVLTAAQIIILNIYGPPVRVTLGEYVVSSSGVNCLIKPYYKECRDKPIVVGVEEVVFHKSLDRWKQLNDIALIRLERDVEYSNYIRPICLPRSNTRLASIGDFVISSGWWPRSDFSIATVKKKSKSKVISQEECQKYFRRVKIEKQHICLNNTGDGRCSFNSGGPIMFSNRFQWHQEGLTTFVNQECGAGGITVGTNITHFMDWILDNIRP